MKALSSFTNILSSVTNESFFVLFCFFYKNIMVSLWNKGKHHIQYTHTHTHIVFLCLIGTLHRHIDFYTVKLYILSPYTNSIPKPTHHRKLSAFLHFQKTLLSMFRKLFSSWGSKNVPISNVGISDIACALLKKYI